MITKLAVIALALAGNFLIVWYGNFSGKLPAKGEYLGIKYNSPFLRALTTQFEYLWVLILINVLFTMMFYFGFRSFNFLTLSIVWIASGPVAALLFNRFLLKEGADWVSLIGIGFVLAGGILVVAHKEILAGIAK